MLTDDQKLDTFERWLHHRGRNSGKESFFERELMRNVCEFLQISVWGKSIEPEDFFQKIKARRRARAKATRERNKPKRREAALRRHQKEFDFPASKRV